MRCDAKQIGFVPVAADHYPLLRRWLAEPHLREWWGDPEEELGFIRDMVDGRDTTRPFLITLDGDPVGYIQYWFIGHHQNEQWIKDHPWLTELPAETIGVDLSIGSPDKLSQGIGSTALAAFVAGLRNQGYSTIIIDPDRNNARAVRAYMKAGFQPLPHLHGQTGDVLIMQHDPDATR
ncbi:GNAT family N-acetyltransferase [Pseudorhodoplanes sinuspersici]|uniref:GNAT family N-acetyltransferase n=1 Tax=Pseudorhodoplanes sinuspersici TaxID=1235591 RepID=A0A1W6ZNQ1_9HYPH|nr:GNAT family N-acetyltransferase [Pseudorhodoplanes sinuspersici]ARP99028.1 GNAT family N-acetyltransferase [Pseudorhodoplanes sinuspersici]RKE69329.1 aminoglycoside 6'-N-acetyltransferase [Pseudorhodoplanes sinuspersici]